jgi:hypothetical protein
MAPRAVDDAVGVEVVDGVEEVDGVPPHLRLPADPGPAHTIGRHSVGWSR